MWFPVVGFVALGMEHAIANMFLIPVGVFSGAGLAFVDVIRNLLVATLGNLAGGTLGVAIPYWLVFGTHERGSLRIATV